MEHPDLASRTRDFTAGEPRAVRVSPDGSRVVFLRSTGPRDAADRLWTFDVPTGLERAVGDFAGIHGYALDGSGRVCACAIDGGLVVADVIDGSARRVPTTGPAHDPRPDPGGRLVAYASGGGLRILDLSSGEDVVLAAESDNAAITWGVADVIAAKSRSVS